MRAQVAIGVVLVGLIALLGFQQIQLLGRIRQLEGASASLSAVGAPARGVDPTSSQGLEAQQATTAQASSPVENPSEAFAESLDERVTALQMQVQQLTQNVTDHHAGLRVPEYNVARPPPPETQQIPKENSRRGWGPEQILGVPDTHEAADAQTAWASRQPDSGPEWLWVNFERPQAVSEVRVRESYNPGAISRVTAMVNGSEISLWEGEAAGGAAPRDFVVPVPDNIWTDSIVVHLDTARVRGWNEIDAVEIVGQDGTRQWARSASASSTYAER